MSAFDLYDMSKYLPIGANGMYDLACPDALRFIKELKSLPTKKMEYYNNIYLDSISYSQYGMCDYWWVIGLYNNVTNPYVLEKEPKQFKFPSVTTIDTFLTKYYRGD